jgi:hypothetical protein
MLESGMAFVIFKALIGFALPLAFAVRELVVLNRLKREREARAAAEAVAASAGPPAAAAPRERERVPAEAA